MREREAIGTFISPCQQMIGRRSLTSKELDQWIAIRKISWCQKSQKTACSLYKIFMLGFLIIQYGICQSLLKLIFLLGRLLKKKF